MKQQLAPDLTTYETTDIHFYLYMQPYIPPWGKLHVCYVIDHHLYTLIIFAY